MAKILSFDNEHVQNSKFYPVLKAFVAGQKELGASVDEVCEPEESKWKLSQNPDDLELDNLWSSIVVLAATTSFKDAAQQKLVDFVVLLQKRPNLEKDRKVCKVQDMTVWRDLPTFGWTIRDAWNFNATESSDQESVDHWINLNAFVAALLATDPSDHLGLALFGIWQARNALEESGKVADVSLAAAATWFVYAGPTLWKYSSEEKTFDGKVAKPGPAFQDNTWRGFSQARWGAWQQKFNDAQGQIKDTTARDLVQQAIEAMREGQ